MEGGRMKKRDNFSRVKYNCARRNAHDIIANEILRLFIDASNNHSKINNCNTQKNNEVRKTYSLFYHRENWPPLFP